MPTEVLMPALSPTMEEGTLSKWLVKEGQEVKSGDVIAEIETDKATMEVEAVDEGRLAKILVPAGTENVKVNTPIALIEGEDEAVPASAPKAEAATPAARNELTDELKAPKTEQPHAEPSRSFEPPSAEPEIAPGTETIQQTMREALRDAMAEEMRRDPDVLLMGEEVAQYQGAYKVSPGPSGRVRRQARHRHADHGAGLCRRRRRRRLRRPQADRRVHDVELRHAGDRPDRELGGQDPLHVGRPRARSDRLPRPQRGGSARRRPA